MVRVRFAVRVGVKVKVRVKVRVSQLSPYLVEPTAI
jgi:hypothetical protein